MALGVGFKIILSVAAVLGVGAIISVAKAGKAPGTPEPRPDDEVPDQIKSFLDKWLTDTAEDVPDAPPQPTHVRWFMYRGYWIDVLEYDDEPEITDDTAWTRGPVAREYTYKGRFRWVVMTGASEYAPPLAGGEVWAEGSSITLAPAPEAGPEEARLAAALTATEQAVAWVDAFLKGK